MGISISKRFIPKWDILHTLIVATTSSTNTRRQHVRFKEQMGKR